MENPSVVASSKYTAALEPGWIVIHSRVGWKSPKIDGKVGIESGKDQEKNEEKLLAHKKKNTSNQLLTVG